MNTYYIRPYVHIEADDAYEAVCRAHACKTLLWDDAFRALDILPASAQVWSRGRYDHLITCKGEWRVPVLCKTNGEALPESALARLKALPYFLDFWYLPVEQLEEAA